MWIRERMKLFNTFNGKEKLLLQNQEKQSNIYQPYKVYGAIILGTSFFGVPFFLSAFQS